MGQMTYHALSYFNRVWAWDKIIKMPDRTGVGMVNPFHTRPIVIPTYNRRSSFCWVIFLKLSYELLNANN